MIRPASKSLPKTTRHRPVVRTLISATLVLFDGALAWLAMLMAVRWRYDSINRPIMADIDHRSAIIAGVVTVIVWAFMRQYRAVWRFTSLADFRRLLLGVVIVMVIVPLIMFLGFDRGLHFPRSAPLIAGTLLGLGIVLSRLIVMAVRNGDVRALYRSPSHFSHDAILIGQASSLYNYLRDTSRRKKAKGFNPIGLIETSGQYAGRSIRSVPILGSPDDLVDIYPKLAQRRSRKLHLLSVDSHPDRHLTEQLIQTASAVGAPLSRETGGKQDGLSRFEAADLIGRDPRQLDMTPVSELISGKRVLITGAGGSIGSELSLQIARLAPSHLALVDISELNLFNLERSLVPVSPYMQPVPWRAYLGDVCNRGRMSEIFEVERPEIVLHAAALKHVPSGERNPVETLRTNVLGTHVTLDMCEIYGVEHFVLISTDKAVDPVNVMGASKRIVELLTLARQSQIPTLHASAVRFGNVLASTGSVVNLFEQQIAEGGPVTVTHEDMNRYFMTVQEASSLVLQAAALNAQQDAGSSHIFVLEMGEPVNIAELARNLIRLRGKIPDEDIEICVTGLRPGEKLSERLTHNEEMLTPTIISGVSQFDACVVNPEAITGAVDQLLSAIERRDRAQIRKALNNLLQGYVPRDTLNGLPVMHDMPNLTNMPPVRPSASDSSSH
ncbi:polysaccharide biosynthesis protein [Algimonas porphyrae]|uniref:Polysaccharide biosynthesis protein CapD n=1 Tax=Algimonas porphyrae TaxID=1128113 RepID=A0ABQ5V2I4_9PROT|nr:polysaccharide biosynthesis protein [Algimonas porphyrae]GLQ20909.1 polysaccharide biosynthesis protein CapD [Algimonas porphyrae]